MVLVLPRMLVLSKKITIVDIKTVFLFSFLFEKGMTYRMPVQLRRNPLSPPLAIPATAGILRILLEAFEFNPNTVYKLHNTFFFLLFQYNQKHCLVTKHFFFC